MSRLPSIGMVKEADCGTTSRSVHTQSTKHAGMLTQLILENWKFNQYGVKVRPEGNGFLEVRYISRLDEEIVSFIEGVNSCYEWMHTP